MNSFVVITFFACLAATNAGLYHHGPSAHVLQGPSSRTSVVGPEGSVISAVAPGGQIVHEEHPGVVAHAAPVYAHAAPAVAYASHHHAPIVAHSGHAVSYAAHSAPIAYAAHHAVPSTVVAHSSAYEHGSAVVAGPSGIISTGHAHHAVPAVAYAAPVVAHAVPVAHAYGYEGQYAHDHSEALYDDGSYKPHVYHH